MQRDYWYTVRARRRRSRSARAGRARKRRAAACAAWAVASFPRAHCPVLYEAPVASSLLSHFVSAIRGTSLYRQASFLLDSIGKPVFARISCASTSSRI